MPPGPRLALALALISGAARADDPPPGPLRPPAPDEFVVIPLRVHVLTSTDLPDVDCALADSDVRKKADEAAARGDAAEAGRLRAWLDEVAEGGQGGPKAP